MKAPPRPFEVTPVEIEVIEEERPAPLPARVDPAPPPKRKRPFARLALGAFSLFLAGALGVEAYDFVADLYARNAVLGGGFLALLAAAVLGVVGVVVVELRALRRLDRFAEYQAEGRRLAAADVHGESDPLLAALDAVYRDRADVKSDVEAYRSRTSDALGDGERLELFSRTVLRPIDKRAYKLVIQGARDIGVVTAISPLGALDGVLVLGRSLMMLRQIARLYGVRPGAAGTLSLLRRSIRNVLLAGLTEVLTDAAAESVGASLAALLSAKAGQGIANGVLAARLGIGAMEACRPLPFAADERPSLKRVRAELFG